MARGNWTEGLNGLGWRAAGRPVGCAVVMAERAVPVEAESYAGGMDATTAKRVKITVWVSPERLDRARKAVAWGKTSSISDWVDDALRKHDSSFGWCTTWQEAFEDWLREVGPLPEEELAWAREQFQEFDRRMGL